MWGQSQPPIVRLSQFAESLGSRSLEAQLKYFVTIQLSLVFSKGSYRLSGLPRISVTFVIQCKHSIHTRRKLQCQIVLSIQLRVGALATVLFSDIYYNNVFVN